jgi:hypothetical protein
MTACCETVCSCADQRSTCTHDAQVVLTTQTECFVFFLVCSFVVVQVFVAFKIHAAHKQGKLLASHAYRVIDGMLAKEQ